MFRPGTHPDPEALRKVVRDTDFTPTDVRFWIQGTIERRPAQDPADLAALVLVSAGSGQRFALTPAEDEDGERRTGCSLEGHDQHPNGVGDSDEAGRRG